MSEYLPCVGAIDTFQPTPLSELFDEPVYGEWFSIGYLSEITAQQLAELFRPRKPEVQTVWIVDDDD